MKQDFGNNLSTRIQLLAQFLQSSFLSVYSFKPSAIRSKLASLSETVRIKNPSNPPVVSPLGAVVSGAADAEIGRLSCELLQDVVKDKTNLSSALGDIREIQGDLNELQEALKNASKVLEKIRAIEDPVEFLVSLYGDEVIPSESKFENLPDIPQLKHLCEIIEKHMPNALNSMPNLKGCFSRSSPTSDSFSNRPQHVMRPIPPEGRTLPESKGG